MFTGHTIRALREALGMTADHFAGLMGVHPATLYRWEAKGDEVARLDPMQLRILLALQRELGKKTTARAQAELGQALLAALVLGGGLFALFKLLEAVFDDSPKRGGSVSPRSAKGGTRPRR